MIVKPLEAGTVKGKGNVRDAAVLQETPRHTKLVKLETEWLALAPTLSHRPQQACNTHGSQSSAKVARNKSCAKHGDDVRRGVRNRDGRRARPMNSRPPSPWLSSRSHCRWQDEPQSPRSAPMACNATASWCSHQSAIAVTTRGPIGQPCTCDSLPRHRDGRASASCSHGVLSRRPAGCLLSPTKESLALASPDAAQ